MSAPFLADWELAADFALDAENDEAREYEIAWEEQFGDDDAEDEE
jgi:hypothetical protein